VGEIDTTFLNKRAAVLYTKLYKEKGKVAADQWWMGYQYKPTGEEFRVFNNEVRRILGQSELPPKGVA
jgi:hypothetical protein